MTRAIVVRYKTHPQDAEENARLVAAVYDALADLGPADFRYSTYRLDDGVSFVHVAEQGGPDNPLVKLPAFAEFQRELASRCAEPPAASPASVVGKYGWF